MPWQNLHSEIADEFSEHTLREAALASALGQLRALKRNQQHERTELWRLRHPERAKAIERACRKRRTFRNMLRRLRGRAPITCQNSRCCVLFVPYYSSCKYCTKACRNRANGMRLHLARKADPLRMRAHLDARSRWWRQRKEAAAA